MTPTVTWAGETNVQFDDAGETLWQGIGGARAAGLYSRFQCLLQRNPRSDLIIIHLGTNDIFADNLGLVRRLILENLKAIKKT